ncbi:MAG: glutathione S-transferase family protein [Gammaproteobacteria bacterium]
MLKLYGFTPSGNSYKPRLLLAHLGVSYAWEEVDITRKATRTQSFLARNPNGKVPLLELDGGELLAESNAILYYFAKGTRFLPADPLAQARVMQWMFFEQYQVEPNIATSRYWIHVLGNPPEYRAQLEAKREPGRAALAVMDGHLSRREFFVGAGLTIADIALYAYTHVAPEGGFDLEPHRHVRAWLERVAAVPGHVAMTDTAHLHA